MEILETRHALTASPGTTTYFRLRAKIQRDPETGELLAVPLAPAAASGPTALMTPLAAARTDA